MKTRKLSARQLRAILPEMPFNNLVGLRLKRVHSDGITLECPLRRDLLNGAGVLHGGVSATLADAAVGIALHRHFGGLTPITTLELKINYFRPVTSRTVLARSWLIRIGSSVCVGRVDLTDSEGNLAGTALVTYMILPGTAGSRS